MLGYLSADIICSEKRTVFRERSSRKTVSFVLKWRFRCSSLRSFFNNIHEKNSPCSLAESMWINPKQCKNLKFFEFRTTNLVQKVEIECKNLKLNWLIGKSRKRKSEMANQIFCFQIKRTRPGWRNSWCNFSLIAWYACVPSAQPWEFFSCIYY